MSGGVELDLGCAESDADEFSSSSKSKQSENISTEEDQVLEENDEDDEIAIIESINVSIPNEHIEPQISIENAYSETIDTNSSIHIRNNSTSNGKRRKTERIPSTSSTSNTTSSSSSRSSSRSSDQSCNDSNEDPIEIISETTEHENEQRKSSNVPTLMITVKNEMAQAMNEEIIVTNDSTETATLRHIFSDAAYFLIKSRNEENISLAKSKGVWSTPPTNETRLNQAFREHRNVILIFSVAESKAFQGFARMSCEARHDSQPVQWILPPGMNNRAFSGVIHIDWITRRSLPFAKTSHLFNSWNENKPVKIGRDGQDVEPRCAEALCRLFPSDPSVDIMSIARKAKNNKKRPSSRSQSRSPVSITVSPSVPLDPSSSSSSTSLMIKRQISKEKTRRSSPSNKHRPTIDVPSSHHFSTRQQHRSPVNHDRHRRQQSRSRERTSKDSQRKRRRRSDSADSNRGGDSYKTNSNRKHTHRHNGDQPSHNSNKTMAKIISSGTYEEYVSHVLGSHSQYAAYGSAMYLPGGYSMGYDPTGFYPMGYDHRGMSLPMHSGGYDMPPDMYLPQPTSYTSSRSRNPANYEQEISEFLRHTSTSNVYPSNDNMNKSHRNPRHHRDDNNYHHHHKSSSRHRSKSREHRR